MSKKLYKLSDDAIFMIREGLQLCLLTGTNFVDIVRGMAFQEAGEGTLTISEEYVTQWNEMVERMNQEAEKKLQELEAATTEQVEAN
jgi:hypothetical protein